MFTQTLRETPASGSRWATLVHLLPSHCRTWRNQSKLRITMHPPWTIWTFPPWSSGTTLGQSSESDCQNASPSKPQWQFGTDLWTWKVNDLKPNNILTKISKSPLTVFQIFGVQQRFGRLSLLRGRTASQDQEICLHLCTQLITRCPLEFLSQFTLLFFHFTFLALVHSEDNRPQRTSW